MGQEIYPPHPICSQQIFPFMWKQTNSMSLGIFVGVFALQQMVIMQYISVFIILFVSDLKEWIVKIVCLHTKVMLFGNYVSHTTEYTQELRHLCSENGP